MRLDVVKPYAKKEKSSQYSIVDIEEIPDYVNGTFLTCVQTEEEECKQQAEITKVAEQAYNNTNGLDKIKEHIVICVGNHVSSVHLAWKVKEGLAYGNYCSASWPCY